MSLPPKTDSTSTPLPPPCRTAILIGWGLAFAALLGIPALFEKKIGLEGLIYGGVITYPLSAFGLSALRRAVQGGQTSFFVWGLGGYSIRMFLPLVFLAIIRQSTPVPIEPLAACVAGATLCAAAGEILALHYQSLATEVRQSNG